MKFDIYGRQPLYFATWCGFLSTMMTFLVIVYFAFLQVTEMMPLFEETMTAPRVSFQVIKQGNVLEFDETFAVWTAQTVSWTGGNSFNIDSETPLTLCDVGTYCYSGEMSPTGARATVEGSNVFLVLKRCSGDGCKPTGQVNQFFTSSQIARTEMTDVYAQTTNVMTQLPITYTKAYSAGGVTTTSVQTNYVDAFNLYYGWKERTALTQMGAQTGNTQAQPSQVSGYLQTYRYDQDTAYTSVMWERPQKTIMTLLATIGGFAVGLWFVMSVLLFVFVENIYSMTTAKAVPKKPTSMKQRRALNRRVRRELRLDRFLAQQILLRSFVKRNTDKAMEKRNDLDHTSSDEENTRRANDSQTTPITRKESIRSPTKSASEKVTDLTFNQRKTATGVIDRIKSSPNKAQGSSFNANEVLKQIRKDRQTNKL